MDKELLLETGKKKGLRNIGIIEKDYFQDLILFHLYKNTNALVFKGGTALYKLYHMPRFSEDLDFTLIEEFDTAGLIEKIAEKLDVRTEVKSMKDSQLFKLRFKGMLTESNTVRIDISIKNKVLKGFDVKGYVPEYIDINPFSLRVLKPDEMITEKVHSILAREKARDVYDLFFLLRIAKFDEKLVNEKLKIFDMSFSFNHFKKKINNIAYAWEKELKPFILTELPDFRTVKAFILERVNLKD